MNSAHAAKLAQKRFANIRIQLENPTKVPPLGAVTSKVIFQTEENFKDFKASCDALDKETTVQRAARLRKEMAHGKEIIVHGIRVNHVRSKHGTLQFRHGKHYVNVSMSEANLF